MNIRFEYLYRDAGNYKNWGDVVFSNKNDHDAEWLEQKAREVLIDSDFFVAEKARVPTLYFDEHIERLDHDWHQFESFMVTSDQTNDPRNRDVLEFLEALEQASKV